MGKNRRRGKVFLGVYTLAIWLIWKGRNSILFAKREEIAKKKKEDIFSAIQNLSKLRIDNRNHNLSVNWDNWCSSPFYV